MPPYEAPPDPSSLTTLASLYEARLRLSPQAPACRHFDTQRQAWCEVTWAELAQRASRFGAALQDQDLRPGERIAVQLAGGPDWMAADWAIQRAGLVTVGLFPDETPAGTARLLADAEVHGLFADDLDLWTSVSRRAELRGLRWVIPVGEPAITQDRRVRRLPEAPTTTLLHLPTPAIDPAALATLVYTSGATGMPMAVMMSHRNLLSNAVATAEALGLRGDDVIHTQLPLTHLFGRTVCVYGAAWCGATLVFGGGGVDLGEELASQKPTVMIGVPRIYERLYAAWQQGLEEAPASRRAFSRLAVEAGWAVRHGAPGTLRSRLLPAALIQRHSAGLQRHLGGRMRLALSGGAALAPQIGRFFCALGVPLVQGYGLTEAGPVVSVDHPGDPDPASCGKPLAGVETRIAANGELQVRGPSVMLGYWRDTAATQHSLDESGWLRTGDKASRLDTDRIYLVGRLKELLVTAGGEKVSPAEVERQLRTLPEIDQVMVVGEGRPFLGALVVPQSGALAMLRASLGLNDGDDSEMALCRIEDALLDRCQAVLGEAPRNHWIARVALVMQPWTPASGLLTATQKLRRSEIERTHRSEVERLYRGYFSSPLTDCSRNATLAT